MPDQVDLHTLFQSKGFTALRVALILGKSKSNIARLCKGTRPLGPLQAEAIAKVIQVAASVVWAAYEVHASDRYKRANKTEPEHGLDLKTLIASKGFTLATLAEKLDTDPSGISRLASGKRRLSEQRAIVIAALLHADLSEVRQAYEQRALPQFKRQSPSSPDETSLNGQKPPQDIEVASRFA